MFASAKESKKIQVGSTAAVSGTVYLSYPLLPFGIVACIFLLTTFLKIAVYIYVISYPHGFSEAFVGTPPQGMAKIRQVNPLDTFKALLQSLLYINLCIFHILCISVAIGLRGCLNEKTRTGASFIPG